MGVYDGLGGPPIFCGLLVDQRRVDRAVGSGGFFLRLLLFLSFGLCLSTVSLSLKYVLKNEIKNKKGGVTY
jgi:hypothetical protein